jgi:hypothetical protein
MTRDNQVKGKQAGNQNEARQQMERADRGSDAGRSSGPESHRLGTSEGGPRSGETKSRISGGNEGGGGGSARSSDR